MKKPFSLLERIHLTVQWSLFTLCILSFSAPALSKPQFGKVYFEYNKTSQELKISTTGDLSSAFYTYDAHQSQFTEKLYKKLCSKIGESNAGGDDFSYLPLSPTVIKWDGDFDSVACSRILFRISGMGAAQLAQKDISVFVTLTADSAAPPDSPKVESQQVVAEAKGFDWIIAGAAAALLLAAIVVAVVVFRTNKKKKKEESSRPHTKTSSLEVVEVVKNQQLKGLDFIKINPSAYYLIDLTNDFADSAVHNIFIHHTTVKKMYDFFKRSLESGDITNETGCYFVGCWEYDSPDHMSYNISLEEIVEPGDDIQPGEFSFNFGLKIGVKLNSTIEKLSRDTGRDYVHTVWMHSHPGLGLFLSSHDLLVQRQLAYSDAKSRLIAFVVDTNTPNLDLAVFSAKSDGSMNNKEDLTHLYSLEDLYLWSRKAHASGDSSHNAVEESVAPPPVDPDKYHALQVNHQGNSRILNIYLGSNVINSIDDILYECEGKHTLAGYLFGTLDPRGNIVVNQCRPSSDFNQPPSDHLGLFIVDDIKDINILQSKYLSNTSALCAFIGCGGDELRILTRNDAKQPFPSLSDAASCSMKPMKEWLRRKRVYK